MSFKVRVFGHLGTRQIQQVNPLQFTSNISETLLQPYVWVQTLTVTGPTPVSTVAVNPPNLGFNDTAQVVMIEVADGCTVRYEFNPPSRILNGVLVGAQAAGTNSPRLSGFNVFPWALNTTISFVDAGSFP